MHRRQQRFFFLGDHVGQLDVLSGELPHVVSRLRLLGWIQVHGDEPVVGRILVGHKVKAVALVGHVVEHVLERERQRYPFELFRSREAVVLQWQHVDTLLGVGILAVVEHEKIAVVRNVGAPHGLGHLDILADHQHVFRLVSADTVVPELGVLVGIGFCTLVRY